MLTVLSIFANQNSIPYHSGLGNTLTGNILAGVVVFVIGAVASAVVKKASTDRKDRAKEVDANFVSLDRKIDERFKTVSDTMDQVARNVDEMLMVWKTPPKTSTNPNPEPGLVERLVGNGGLFDQVDLLIKDSQKNGGNSSRDVLDRIDTATGHL